jgi:hypothetical protein
MQGALPDGAAAQTDLAKGLDLMFDDVAGDSARLLSQTKLRDPFLPVAQAVAASAMVDPAAPAGPERDPLADIVAGLTLNATIIQGRDQFAIIDGRIYNRGQRLILPGEDPSRPPLVVLFVNRTGVILRGGAKNYTLAYPERLTYKRKEADGTPGDQANSALTDPAGQAEMFQKLLNSPLGALGKSLIGDVGRSKADPRRRSAKQ